MSRIDNEFYVCVNKDQAHIPDATLTKCSRCPQEVWISNHNIDKNPICWKCASMLPKDTKFAISDKDKERVTQEITEMEKRWQGIFDRVILFNDKWKHNPDVLKSIIKMADRHRDGYKRVAIGGKTYLVPIEDIICFGIKGSEVSEKYEEAK